MYFLKEKFARDEQATAGSAVSFAWAELVEVASAAAKVRGFGEFGEEDASPAAIVCGFETRNPEANQRPERNGGSAPAFQSRSAARRGSSVALAEQMNVFDAASTLPNGLHDAYLKSCVIDFATGTARLELDAWTGDLDSPQKDERERYEPVELCLLGLIYFHIDSGEKWHLRPVMPSRVDLCEADPKLFPEITGLVEYFKARFFVEDRNSFIHFAALDATVSKI